MTTDVHVDTLVVSTINGGAPLLDPATTAGDLLVFDGTSLQRLGVGANGTLLTPDSSQPLKMKWGGGPMTTAGDMIVGGGSGAPTRLPKGPDTYTLTMVGGAVTWAAPSGGGSPPPVNAQTGTAYTLVLTDAPASSASSGIVSMNNAAANVVTVPTHAAVAFPKGTTIQIPQLGAGSTSVAGDTGVTVRTPSTLIARTQDSTLLLTNMDTDLWVLSGDMQ